MYGRMGTKTKFSRTDELSYFLTHGAPRKVLLYNISLCAEITLF